MARIIIGGDICPSNGNMSSFVDGETGEIFHDILAEFEQADLVVANLECPLVRERSPIAKHGPNLGADVRCIETLGRAGIDVLNLANNHILDHGQAGLESTLEACSGAGIDTVGAGNTLGEAGRILIRDASGVRVAIMGMAEREFSTASNTSGGANPLDMVKFVRDMALSDRDWDYLAVLVHGGNEYYPYPSPRLKDICRFMVEMGADAVIVQHTHCPGCFEEYMGGHIVYGQGNLIFDSPGKSESFYEGFLVSLEIGSDMRANMNIVPYTQSLDHVGTMKMNGQRDEAFRELIRLRNSLVKDDEFLARRWYQFCKERKNAYLSGLLGHGRFLQRLNRNGDIVRHLYPEKSLLRAQNFITCDAHREALETILKAMG